MSRRRRILMTADAVGGVWQYATELATALAGLGHETILVLLGPPPSDAQREAILARNGVTLVDTGQALDWLAPDAAAVRAAGLAIARLASEWRVDVVHLNQPALAADVAFPVPLVVVAHSCVATWWDAVRGGAAPAEFGWQTALVHRGLVQADAVVCPSRAFASALGARYGLPSPPDVVHNGRTLRAAPGAARRDFAFTAGRLWDEGKNIATLDRAAACLEVPFQAAGPLVGPNGQRVALAHLHPLGAIDERTLAGCLSARPVFVSAARYEPFGLAVLEAALAGCPLVLADIPTFRELWEGVALFVDPGDALGFAKTVERLVGDASIRLMRGDLARRRARRFAPRRMAGGMIEIYARLLDRVPHREVAA